MGQSWRVVAVGVSASAWTGLEVLLQNNPARRYPGRQVVDLSTTDTATQNSMISFSVSPRSISAQSSHVAQRGPPIASC